MTDTQQASEFDRQMTVLDHLDTIEEFLGDAENFELADDSTVDATPAGDSLKAIAAALEAKNAENEDLKRRLAEALEVLGRTSASLGAEIAKLKEELDRLRSSKRERKWRRERNVPWATQLLFRWGGRTFDNGDKG